MIESDNTPVIVLVRDLRKIKYCRPGNEYWFDLHGLDYQDFRRNGISSEILEGIDDIMVTKAIEQARSRLRGQ